MRSLPLLAVVLFVLLLSGLSSAKTYDVGPGYPYTTIASVPSLVGGDVVNIHCGTYNEVRNWTTSGTPTAPITLQGVCSTSRPVIDGHGRDTSGNNGGPRGVWQISGAYYNIKYLAFQNARNSSGNAAGIRVLNTGVTITNVKITYDDMGLMTSSASATNLLVQNSEIAYNGTSPQDAGSHNIYLTAGDKITFRYCWIHDSVSGSNLKTRAHYTALLYSYVAYGQQNEVDGDDSTYTSSPNSNLTLIGNIIVSKANRTLNTNQFIYFGQDIGGAHNGTLYLVNNTLVAGSGSINFLRNTASASRIIAVNNIFYGSNAIVNPSYAAGISGYNNWMPSTAAVPSSFSNTTRGTTPGFVSASTGNYHLTSTSSAINIGYGAPLYYDGTGVSHSAVPVWQYVQPLGGTPRVTNVSIDAGAYEY